MLLAAALTGAVGGCGLPANPQAPPPRPTAPSASTILHRFTFSQPQLTDAVGDTVGVFGHEVYYRFSAPGAFTDRNLGSLAAVRRRFVRLADADKRHPVDQADRPLIKVPNTGRHETITLDFSPVSGGGDPVATGTGGVSDVSLRRGVEQPDGSYEKFTCDQFQAGDADVAALPQLANDCAGEPFQLQLYVLAYGRGGDGRERYSEPLYLGSIFLTLP